MFAPHSAVLFVVASSSHPPTWWTGSRNKSKYFIVIWKATASASRVQASLQYFFNGSRLCLKIQQKSKVVVLLALAPLLMLWKWELDVIYYSPTTGRHFCSSLAALFCHSHSFIWPGRRRPPLTRFWPFSSLTRDGWRGMRPRWKDKACFLLYCHILSTSQLYCIVLLWPPFKHPSIQWFFRDENWWTRRWSGLA